MGWRRLLFFPPLVLGLLVYLGMQRLGASQDASSTEVVAAPVRVLALQPVSYAAFVSGYGRVEPEQTWQAIAQVSGRVATLKQDLAIGSLVRKDAELLTIEARDYEIALAKADANLSTAKASLAELEVQEANTASLLEIEQRVESVQKSDFERQRKLSDRGASSQAAVDSAERSLLSQQKVVQDLENQMRLYPVQRVSLEETIRTREVEREEAERDLANTKIAAPFNGRVSEKSIAVAQYVRSGDALLTLEDIATVEVVAEFQPSELRPVILVHGPERLQELIISRNDREALNFFRRLGMSAEVVVQVGEERFVWPAEIMRITGRADEETGAIGIAVRVTDPMRLDVETRRPPLNPGLFAEVRIRAQPRPLLLAPRAAVRRDPEQADPFIYVMDDEDRLRRRTVHLGAVFDQQVVLAEGAAAGDRVVLSDLNPAILGMPLQAAANPQSGDAAARARPESAVEAKAVVEAEAQP